MNKTARLTHSVLFLTILILCSRSALAAETFSLNNASASGSYLSFLQGDYTLTFGARGFFEPVFVGSKKNQPAFLPIVSFNKIGTLESFSSPHDSFGAAVIETAFFRTGPVLGFQLPRSPRDDKALTGLKKVGFAIEPGFFAEILPTNHTRMRVELRQGVTGHYGQIIDFSADLYTRFADRWLIAVGPRFAITSARSLKPYFDIDTAQSLNSGLSLYTNKSGIKNVGFGSVIKYSWTPKLETEVFAEYERFVGSVAKSPLVQIKGNRNQVIAGVGISYKFDFTSPVGK